MGFLRGCTLKIIDNVDTSSYYAYGRLDFSPQGVVDHPCVRLQTEQQVLSAIERPMPLLAWDVTI
jgi:hypothetical protein